MKHTYDKLIYKIALCYGLVSSTILSTENDKENILFVHPNIKVPNDAVDLNNSLAKSPYSTPPRSPSKKAGGSSGALRDAQQSRRISPHNSPQSSPTKKSPTSSPTKSPVKLNAKRQPNKAGIQKKLDFGIADRIHLDPINAGPEQGDFVKAIELSKVAAIPQTNTKERVYLCALPTKQTSLDIDNLLMETSLSLPTYSVAEKYFGLLAARLPYTVLNCATIEWPYPKKFHMSLKLSKTGEAVDEKEIKDLLGRVEFAFKKIDILGRFIVIRLDHPSVLNGCKVSDSEMKALKTYLEYDHDEPMMHVSLVKVNDVNSQMSCIDMGTNEAMVPINPKVIALHIERAKNKGKHIQMSGITKSLSEISLWLLHLKGENVRDYVSRIKQISGNEKAVYDYIHKCAIIGLDNFSQLPTVAQFLIRDEFKVDYDFEGQIGIKIDGNEEYPINKSLASQFLSSIFIKHQYSCPELEQFQTLAKLCISNTRYAIENRRRDISVGIPQGELDVESIGGIFDSQWTELSPRSKDIRRAENEVDSAFLKELEENLALHLIETTFFGFNLDTSFFVEFTQQNQPMIQKILSSNVNQAMQDTLLRELQHSLKAAMKCHFLDKKFSINKQFGVRKFIDSLTPFVCISSKDSDQLKQHISQEMKMVEDYHRARARSGATELITFANSKIPDVHFWYAYRDVLQTTFQKGMAHKFLQFNELSHQAIDDELDDTEG